MNVLEDCRVLGAHVSARVNWNNDYIALASEVIPTGPSEVLSKYLETELNLYNNLDEMDYRKKIQPTEKAYSHAREWIKNMHREKFEIPSILKKKGIEFRGSILEIGAGSCWFSSVFCKFNEVKEVRALHFR